MGPAGITVRSANWEDERDRIRFIRSTVFSEEQGISEAIEFDGLDAECFHVLALTDADRPVGTGRVQKDGHLGRVAVLKEWRNRGIGSALVEQLARVAADEGLRRIHLHSQAHAVAFYRKLGFRKAGGPFMEAGIEHCRMERDTGLPQK